MMGRVLGRLNGLSRFLVISKPDYNAYVSLLKLAGSRDVLWVSSNPYLPSKVTGNRNATLIAFNTDRFDSLSVNPTDLRDLFRQIVSNISHGCAVILSCLSELLAIHSFEKVYDFLLQLTNAVERRGGIVIGMLIEGAQRRREEILISTVFDATLKVGEILNSFETLSNEVNLSTGLP